MSKGMNYRSAWAPDAMVSTLRAKRTRLKNKRSEQEAIYPIISKSAKVSIVYPSNRKVTTHLHGKDDIKRTIRAACSNEKENLFRNIVKKGKVKKDTIDYIENFLTPDVNPHEEIEEKLKLHVLSQAKTNVRLSESYIRFCLFYDRGDLPACISHGARRKLQWKTSLDDIDIQHYLPVFTDGLCVNKEPYSFISFRGLTDLIDFSKRSQCSNLDRIEFFKSIQETIPRIIFPIKAALDTKNRTIISKVMVVLQKLIQIRLGNKYMGKHFTKYFRQLLPCFNMILVLHKKRNLGDEFDYRQTSSINKLQGLVGDNIVDLAMETLQMMEQFGGKNARQYIKHYVPSFH